MKSSLRTCKLTQTLTASARHSWATTVSSTAILTPATLVSTAELQVAGWCITISVSCSRFFARSYFQQPDSFQDITLFECKFFQCLYITSALMCNMKQRFFKYLMLYTRSRITYTHTPTQVWLMKFPETSRPVWSTWFLAFTSLIRPTRTLLKTSFGLLRRWASWTPRYVW